MPSQEHARAAKAALIFSGGALLLVLARCAALPLGAALLRAAGLPLHGPLRMHAAWIAGNVVLLLGVPLALTLALRAPPATLGLAMGQPAQWIIPLLLGLPACVAAALLLSRLPAVATFYRAHTTHVIGADGWILWTVSWGTYFLAWEFVFRGVLVLGLARYVGERAAIALHLLPFVAVHAGKPALELGLAVPGGILLGALACRSRSVLPSWLLHWGLAASLDMAAALGR